MNIEERLKTLIVERYGNMLNFSNKIGMANSTLATIMKKGIHNANVSNIIKICKELGISADALANDEIIPTSANHDDLIFTYAKKLMELSAESKDNAMKYIDFLTKQEDDE